mgnify:CR=1 FL=1|jgi:hypothetical protein
MEIIENTNQSQKNIDTTEGLPAIEEKQSHENSVNQKLNNFLDSNNLTENDE